MAHHSRSPTKMFIGPRDRPQETVLMWVNEPMCMYEMVSFFPPSVVPLVGRCLSLVWWVGLGEWPSSSKPPAQGSMAPGGFLHVLYTETVLIVGKYIRLQKSVVSSFPYIIQGSFLRPALLAVLNYLTPLQDLPKNV